MKQTKRILSVVLCLLMLIAVVPLTHASAEAGTLAGGSCGKNGSNLKWVLNDNGDLIISGRGEMANFDDDTPPWLKELDGLFKDALGYSSRESLARALANRRVSLETVAETYAEFANLINGRIIVEEGVTSIGDYAFEGWSATEVELPSSLKTIGSCAFLENCFESLFIPAGTKTIKDLAFQYVPLKEVDLPASLSYIDSAAFCGNNLDTLVFWGNPTIQKEAIEITCYEKKKDVLFDNAEMYHRFQRVYDDVNMLGHIEYSLPDLFEYDVEKFQKENNCSNAYAEAMVTLDYLDQISDFNVKHQTYFCDFSEISDYLFWDIQSELGVRIGSVDDILEQGQMTYNDDGKPYYYAAETDAFYDLIDNYFDASYVDLIQFDTREEFGKKSTKYSAAPWIEVYGYTGTVAEQKAKASGAQFIALDDPDDSDSTNPNACKYCGQVHTGLFGWLIKFFHSILAFFKRYPLSALRATSPKGGSTNNITRLFKGRVFFCFYRPVRRAVREPLSAGTPTLFCALFLPDWANAVW